MKERNGLILNIIGMYFLFSLIAGIILKQDILEMLMLDGMFNDSSVLAMFNFVIVTNALIAFLLFYSGIRRYIFYRRDKKEEKPKKKDKKKKEEEEKE